MTEKYAEGTQMDLDLMLNNTGTVRQTEGLSLSMAAQIDLMKKLTICSYSEIWREKR